MNFMGAPGSLKTPVVNGHKVVELEPKGAIGSDDGVFELFHRQV